MLSFAKLLMYAQWICAIEIKRNDLIAFIETTQMLEKLTELSKFMYQASFKPSGNGGFVAFN